MKCACAVSISLAIVSESHISSSDSRFSLDKCTPGGGVWGEGKVIIQPWTQFVGDGTYAAPHKYLNQNLYDCWHLAKSIPSSSGGGDDCVILKSSTNTCTCTRHVLVEASRENNDSNAEFIELPFIEQLSL